MKDREQRQPTIDNADARYGAPMGRKSYRPDTPVSATDDREACTPVAIKTVRVFRVVIDSQGYDIGGAYWGTGERLYCATDSMNFRQFTRAANRTEAINKLGIDASLLARKG